MATLTLTRSITCTAENHFTLTATGDVNHEAHFSVEQFSAPPTEVEKDAFVKLLVKFARIGRTNQQVLTALNNGVVVTV